MISLKWRKTAPWRIEILQAESRNFVYVLERAQNFISWANPKFNAMKIDPTPADSLPLACVLFQTNDMGHNYFWS